MPRPDTDRIIKPTDIMPLTDESRRICEQWKKELRFKPNPKHKLYPWKYGLDIPPYARRIDSLCEEDLPDLTIQQSIGLLQEAFSLCMVSLLQKNGYPSRVFAVAETGDGEEVVCEARYEGKDNDAGKIVYHGFPYKPSHHPFYRKVIREWNKRKRTLLSAD